MNTHEEEKKQLNVVYNIYIHIFNLTVINSKYQFVFKFNGNTRMALKFNNGYVLEN